MDISIDTLLNAYLIPWGTKIVLVLVIFVVGRWIARLLASTLQKVMTQDEVGPMLVNFLGNIACIALLAMVVLAAMEQLGVNTTFALAILGAAGLAVCLSLKGTLSSFAAGVMLLELGENSVDFTVRSWVKSSDHWTTRADLLETVKTKFDQEGINIPYPQRDVQLFNMGAA